MFVVKYWRWIVSGILAVIALGLLIAYKLSNRKDLGHAAVAAIESAHGARLLELNTRHDVLMSNLNSQTVDIKRAEDAMEAKRDALTRVYDGVGLSADEVAARLAKFNL